MAKNKVEVIIGGNIYSLQGEESNQHIQQVAALIDQKLLEIQKNYGTKRLSTSQLYMLSAINIADEYLKTKEELDEKYLKTKEELDEKYLKTKEELGEKYLKTKEELDVYIRELEKCNRENLALLERIEELGLEMNRIKLGQQSK